MTEEYLSPYNTLVLPKPQTVHFALKAYLAVHGPTHLKTSLKLLSVREVDLDDVDDPAVFALGRVIVATRAVLDELKRGTLACATEDNNVAIVQNRWWRYLETRRRLKTRAALLPLLRYEICVVKEYRSERYFVTFNLPPSLTDDLSEVLQLNGYNPEIVGEDNLRIRVL